ncbi:unnamed protein product [Tilletia controversa]|uniref:Inositol polyphosphate-related phosphatase domain-containing protein n=1 Tax=Tilletia controversa TaxID=13291 RepID=A0A8X7MTM8_9BASI|nr:hypothetical protein CF328_g3057 [Tilletia controversa]KAE8248240.1 hypothetical protein A4X06_0g3856 [Tilletia controversa]CAD6897706.1 unnamed protein product [Tilletia controversa]CAD6968062.1 unnamed protein product [Tilletia controversa]
MDSQQQQQQQQQQQRTHDREQQPQRTPPPAAAASGDNEEATSAQQQPSVSSLRSRFEQMETTVSKPSPAISSPPPPSPRPARQGHVHHLSQQFSMAAPVRPQQPARPESTFSVKSKISLPDGSIAALGWADGTTPSPAMTPSHLENTPALPSPPPLPQTQAIAGSAQLPAPKLPPRPEGIAEQHMSPPLAPPQRAPPPPPVPGPKPAPSPLTISTSTSPSNTITPAASVPHRPPPPPPSPLSSYSKPAPPPVAHPSVPISSPISITGNANRPPIPISASYTAPKPALHPSSSSSSASSASTSSSRAFPPPLLRSQHSHHVPLSTSPGTPGAGLMPPASHWGQRAASPTSSTSVTEDEDEEGEDLFSASSDDDAAGEYLGDVLADDAITSPDGTPMSRHLSLRRSPGGKHDRKRSIGARKALESVTSTTTFLSRSMSMRTPTTSQGSSQAALISLSPPGSSASSRPGSSGGTTPVRGATIAVGGGLRSSALYTRGLVEHFPDATHVNRRPPSFCPPRSAIAKSEFVDFDVCGSVVVTATHEGKVKVYKLPTTNANTSHSGKGLSPTINQKSPNHQIYSGSGKYAGADKVFEIEIRGSKGGVEGAGGREKITALSFRCPAPAETHAASRKTMGRYVWVATKDGGIYEIDLSEARVVDNKMNLHSTAIILLERVGDKMISLDDGGKISTWVATPSAAAEGNGKMDASCVTLQTKPSTQRIGLDKHACPLILGDQLWICTGPHANNHGNNNNNTGGNSFGGQGIRGHPNTVSGLRISIYNPPFVENRNFSAVSRPVSLPRDMPSAGEVGPVSSGATIPSRPELVYLGHESGHVTVWSKSTFTCVAIQRLGRHCVVAMAGVVRYLWVGTRAGEMCVYDPGEDITTPNWRLLKKWTAHKEAIFKLLVDRAASEVPQLQVGSAGEDGCVHFWDGTLLADWLDKAVLCREAEFCTFRSLRCLITTFNIDAACPLDLQRGGASENVDFLETLITNATRKHGADILVFGFQELIDLEKKSLTAKTLLVGKNRLADKMGAKISANYRQWYEALTRAVMIYGPRDQPYKVIASDSLVGLFSLVLVRQSESSNIRDAATGVTKVGLGGRYGNKGAIATRFVVDDTSVSFVNCHLSAGQRAVKRRNEDVADILEDPDVFEQPIENTDAFVPGGDGRMILDHTLCFFSGDLNYRIDERRDTTISLIRDRRLEHLLALDQLRTQMATNPTFRLRYFTEAGPPRFEPTYKYDKHTHEWDSSAKQRIPAWCDRILWREQGADWSRARLTWAPTAQSSLNVGDQVGEENEDNDTPDQEHPPPPSHSNSTPTRPTGRHPGPVSGQGHVRVLGYRRWETTISDHRPVTGLFEIKVRRVQPEQKEDVLAQLKEEWKEVEREMVGLANSLWWL